MKISVEARQIGGCVAGLHFHTGWLDFSKHTLFSTPNLISIGRGKHVWSPITAAFVLQLHGYLCRAKHHQGYHEQPMWFFIFLKVLAVHTNLQLRNIVCTLKVHLQIRNCGARDQQKYSAPHKITDYAPEVRSRNEIRQWKPRIKGLLITQSVSKLVSQNAFQF